MGKLIIGDRFNMETDLWAEPQLVALEYTLNAIVGNGMSTILELEVDHDQVYSFIISPGILVMMERSVLVRDMNAEQIDEVANSMFDSHEKNKIITLSLRSTRPVV